MFGAQFLAFVYSRNNMPNVAIITLSERLLVRSGAQFTQFVLDDKCDFVALHINIKI